MLPHFTKPTFDLEALSGICGSISIACWVVVFTPQIIENFRRSSAEGLSIVFIVVWLLGDLFNILGAILQGVLPTMIILAVYYTLADIVLMLQVFYYRGFTLSDAPQAKPALSSNANADANETLSDGERQPLLGAPSPDIEAATRRRSFGEQIRDQLLNPGAEHLSPATPMIDPAHHAQSETVDQSTSSFKTALFNAAAVLAVCLAGILGWYLSTLHSHRTSRHHTSKSIHSTSFPSSLQFDPLGQFFGYLCAVFYLASRLPQLLLNYRRKSTEGVSLLFFLFACLGNLTYDMSIFAYDPELLCEAGAGRCADGEARMIYARYIAVNASWIIGSLGTLVLDFAIFVQFWWYKNNKAPECAIVEEGENGYAH